MAHATPLTLDLHRKKTRPAAAGGRVPAVNDTQLQLRLPADAVRSIKRDAIEAGQSISAFMLACWHTSKKANLKLKK